MKKSRLRKMKCLTISVTDLVVQSTESKEFGVELFRVYYRLCHYCVPWPPLWDLASCSVKHRWWERTLLWSTESKMHKVWLTNSGFWPASLLSSGDLLEKQTLGLSPRFKESETLDLKPSNLGLNTPPWVIGMTNEIWKLATTTTKVYFKPHVMVQVFNPSAQKWRQED